MGGMPKARKARDILKTVSVNDSLPSKERRLIRQIQEALSVDLLDKAYRGYASPTDHYVRGHCFIATEAFYYLGGRSLGYKQQFARVGGGVTHWWLVHTATGRIADPTEPQVSAGFDYSSGSGQSFGSTSPNKRTLELMRRVRRKRIRSY